MNPSVSKSEETELINQFIDSLSSLPKDLLANVGFITALRDVSTAIEIAEKLGVPVASSDQQQRIGEGISSAKGLGRIMRNEVTSSTETAMLRELYRSISEDLQQIQRAVISAQELILSRDLSQFAVCSVEHGCSGPEAADLLTLKDPSRFDQIVGLARWLVNRIAEGS